MYNFNFLENEELVEVLDQVLIRNKNDEKITSIALTNKRLLFLDYISNDGYETLRITRGINFIKYKEVYYQCNLKDIRSITDGEYYKITLNNDLYFEFNNERLYNLLKGNK